MKKALITLVTLAVPFLTLTSSWSQEDVGAVEGIETMEEVEAAEEAEDVADHEFAYGVLVSKTNSQLTLSEYNFDTGADENVVYTVNADTEYEGGITLADLQPGAEVEVLFLTQGDQKVAALISAPGPSDGLDMGEQTGADEGGADTMESDVTAPENETLQPDEGSVPEEGYDGGTRG